jgi:Uma2 family endonuclease
MSTIMRRLLTAPEPERFPSARILGGLFRMNVEQYEQLVETGVLDGQPIELINGLLVRRMGKKPPHVVACEATRDELLPLIPRGWRLTIEAPIRIPEFDEPEPDLGIIRGTRDQFADDHPGPADVGLLIEVSDTTLELDRGEKQLAYARGKVPVYWIVNLVDRRVEVYTGPTPTGYRNRRVLAPGEHVSLMIGRREIGRIDVSAILPKDRRAGGTGPAKNG